MFASLHDSPTCRAHALQQSQPSTSRLTPVGHAGGVWGQSHGHVQNCVRLYGSIVVMETVAEGGMAVAFWEVVCGGGGRGG